MMSISRIPTQWRQTLAVASAMVAGILALYWRTGYTIVDTWAHSGTYAHGFLIVPISAWLIWQRRHGLAAMVPKPTLAMIPVVGGLGLVWLLAHAIEVLIVQQLCLVAMILGTLVGLMGWRVAGYIAFPLGFLFLAVPMGADLIPPMMHFTADFSVRALQLTGIPVLWEGPYITLPDGRWQVAAACSGVRYLIASVTLGCLYAYLMYRSYWRRAIFIAISAVVPIIANGIRAYMIIMLGYLSGMKLAVGVDHIIYGWIFFGVVIGLLFFVGSLWREDLDADGQRNEKDDIEFSAGASVKRPPLQRVLLSASGIGVAGLIWPLLVHIPNGSSQVSADVHLSAPLPSAQWAISKRRWNWNPRYIDPQARIAKFYNGQGGTVGLYIEYYGTQRQGRELIGSQNVLVHEHNKQWRYIKDEVITVVMEGKPIKIRQAYLDSKDVKLLVWYWYWVGGRTTTNEYVAKALEGKDKLFGNGAQSAAVMLATSYDMTTTKAKGRLKKFMDDMYPGIGRALAGAEQGHVSVGEAR